MKTASDYILSTRSRLVGRFSAYYELTKPGITLMVLTSMLVGFILGSKGYVNLGMMFHAMLGTLLIASGTAAHNQFIERNLDKLMNRTNKRPIPSERVSPQKAFIFSVILILSGLSYLLVMVNTAAGIISAVTTLLYLGVYTPMKRRTFLNVVVGSIPGALPPVGGWAAATGSIGEPVVWLLFGVVFLWQVPHVLAIAWICNDDYTNAGFQMLPANDESGLKTSLLSVVCLVLLLPVVFGIYYSGSLGLLFLYSGFAATLFYMFYGVKFLKKRTPKRARYLMFASFFYLPVVWLMLFLDKLFL